MAMTIILLVVTYIIGFLGALSILTRYCKDFDKYDSLAYATIWPIIIILLPLMLISALVLHIIDFLKK